MGQLAITRAIGDTDLKPYITSEPEIVSFELEGDEDFLIMGSDGLWDGVTDDVAASEVYNRLKENPGKPRGVGLRSEGGMCGGLIKICGGGRGFVK